MNIEKVNKTIELYKVYLSKQNQSKNDLLIEKKELLIIKSLTKNVF